MNILAKNTVLTSLFWDKQDCRDMPRHVFFSCFSFSVFVCFKLFECMVTIKFFPSLKLMALVTFCHPKKWLYELQNVTRASTDTMMTTKRVKLSFLVNYLLQRRALEMTDEPGTPQRQPLAAKMSAEGKQ